MSGNRQNSNHPKIGVLALQGDFDAHRRRLEELGAEVVLVKKPEQLDHIDGLVIPGGESGTFLKLLGDDDSLQTNPLRRSSPARRSKWFSSALPKSSRSETT
jgi:glutamine amidotransferase PdxT